MVIFTSNFFLRKFPEQAFLRSACKKRWEGLLSCQDEQTRHTEQRCVQKIIGFSLLTIMHIIEAEALHGSYLDLLLWL